jgi:NADH dehydrogenase/NADH:ubiquinone oxidoreductase subunit G
LEAVVQSSRPADRIRDPWGVRTPFDHGSEWAVRVDECYADGVDPARVQRWVPSASLLHSTGDALDIAVADDRIVGVRGRAEDRVNRGRLDVKDLYAWQANHAGDRLTAPLIRRGGTLRPTDWDTAMAAVIDRSRQVLAEHGPGAIGFYTTGQLFAEEYYTLTTIVRAGIGTNHLDGNTRLCIATAGEALKETFGSDGQPASYTDIDHAEVIALFGHNVAETQPVLWMRIPGRLAGAHPPRPLVVARGRPSPQPFADVVLPAATWGEKTGAFTNADRTVHLSEKTIETTGRCPSGPGHLPALRRRHALHRQARPKLDHLDRRRLGIRSVQTVQRQTPLRLPRHHLRPAARARRHPMALHRQLPGRDRTALHRRQLLDERGAVRVLRPRPDHRRLRRGGRRSTSGAF